MMMPSDLALPTAVSHFIHVGLQVSFRSLLETLCLAACCWDRKQHLSCVLFDLPTALLVMLFRMGNNKQYSIVTL